MRGLFISAALLAALPSPAAAQPVDLPIPAAKTTAFPAGIRVGKVGGKAVYVDGKGRVLYGMDMRVLLRDGPDPAQYCTGACAAAWEPALAPANSVPNIAYPRGFDPGARALPLPAGFITQPQNAPDWTIIAGPQGPQWVYKGWHMVFTRRGGDARSDRLEGADGRIWNTLKFVPPAPVVKAPAGVRAIPVDGGYALADDKGRLLFSGNCGKACDGWEAFRGGAASAAVGQWRVASDSDQPQWTLAGKPVFVSPDDAPVAIPPDGKVLRP